MTPLDRYTEALDTGKLAPDDEQKAVVLELNAIHNSLVSSPHRKSHSGGLLTRLFSRSSPMVSPVKGLYLWGGVGRGKTFLTDLFYAGIPIKSKTRLHYHHFMKLIHEDLKQLKDIENPLAIIAQRRIDETRLLVLDEMHVNDITDAMLLGGLLTALFEQGTTLVTTSNVAPDDLYKNGLQRDRFLPAIEQIKQHTNVFGMQGATDYRLRALESANTYFLVSDKSARNELQQHFDRLCSSPGSDTSDPLVINRRELQVVRAGDGVAWFTFDELCNTPRSTHDYIEIATVFHSVILSDVPVLDDTRNDEARRLVNLVDELYDRSVNLIVSAEAVPNALYRGKRLAFEFVRAASRLSEMQTVDYLARHHNINNYE